jgi:nucleotide-binding universal stress UspA family protein
MTIICGTDLSHASTGAMAVARALATLRGETEVIVVHAVDSDAEGEVEHLRAALEDIIAHAGEGPTLRPELVVGPPETALTSFAETEGSELIVIASASSDKTSTLGTTAAKIIAITRTPVLVLRDPAPWLAFCAKTRPLKALAAVDDSIASELGLQWTHGLRRQGPVEVVVGAVYYPDDAAEQYGVHAKTLVDRDPEIEQLLSRDLIRRFGAGDGVVARTRRGLGRIGDDVIELANEEHVDVVIVGTSQRTGLDRLGSVSSIVVQDAPQSVVCVPPQATLPTFVVPVMSSALVATDLSPFANRAVAYAFAAVPENGEIHIAHVAGEDDAIDEADITKQLLAQAPAIAMPGVPRKVTAHVVRGDDAATAIAQTAARLGVDFIVIASRGRTGISRALLGSVADKLLRATRKPVLVLRPG